MQASRLEASRHFCERVLLCRHGTVSAGSETGDARPLLQEERSNSGGLTLRGQRPVAPQTTADSADVKVSIFLYWAGFGMHICGVADHLAGYDSLAEFPAFAEPT